MQQSPLIPSRKLDFHLVPENNTNNAHNIYDETLTTRTDFLISSVLYTFDAILCLLFLCYRRYKTPSRKRTISNTNLLFENPTSGINSATLLASSTRSTQSESIHETTTIYENLSRLLMSPNLNAFLLTLAFLIRALWCFARAYDPNFTSSKSLSERLWNKFVLFLLFTSFGLILLKWIVSLRQDGMPFAKRTFAIISCLLFIEMLFMAIYEGGGLAENILISFVFLLMSIMFTWIGMIIRKRLNKFAQSNVVRINSKRICITSNTCTILFLIRCFAYVYWPLSNFRGFENKTIQRWYYPWLYYTIPESVNGICVLYLMLPVQPGNVNNNNRENDNRDGRIDSWTADNDDDDYSFSDRNTGSGRGPFAFLPKHNNNDEDESSSSHPNSNHNRSQTSGNIDRNSTVTYL